jgi:hypothetical protein
MGCMGLVGVVLVIQVHCCLGSLIWNFAPATETEHLQASAHQFILLPKQIYHKAQFKRTAAPYIHSTGHHEIKSTKTTNKLGRINYT